MLSRTEFAERFGRQAIFGMVHLRPLPGAPMFGGSLDAVIATAIADAHALAAGGCDGVVFENFGDRPFRKRVDAETIAAMTRVITEAAREISIPHGVNVLRNDARAALGIAAATGAAFIRINIHIGVMVADQGIIEGEAAETLRHRAHFAPKAMIFADHMVKHAAPIGLVDAVQMARDLRERGMADAVIITGRETGAPADVARLMQTRAAIEAPILIGSGLTSENAGAYADADGAIVGTSVKRDGNVELPVDPVRVERVVRAFKQLVVR
ncbi:MAG TPA: BtpA/SgcQ family protein [Thermoanaerobaculia bacterium]|nr:BtpA/SgcQ family protein [Thermoanaerobaculia bacterium]